MAAVDYRFPWDELVGRFKFRDGLDLGTAFSRLLVDAVRGSGDLQADLVVPVPLSPSRLAERGYNQAWELARRVGAELRLPAMPTVLQRPLDTAHQAALPKQQRVTNLRGAFLVQAAQAHHIAGRRVAVVDDVMTTGATLAEIARVLKAAGASAVDGWVVARTPAPADA